MRPCERSGRPSEQDILRAAMIIKKGGVAAVPTETYYGLAADPDNEQALLRIFALKQRPEHKPILILISRVEQLDLYARQIPAQYRRLMERFWPGPLTLVFPARDSLSNILTGGTSTVGIRLTPNPVALAIIEKLGKPITATSANITGYEPARSVEQVMMMFGDRLDCIVDGGPAVETRPSTVVTVDKGRLKVLREGLVDIGGG